MVEDTEDVRGVGVGVRRQKLVILLLENGVKLLVYHLVVARHELERFFHGSIVSRFSKSGNDDRSGVSGPRG